MRIIPTLVAITVIGLAAVPAPAGNIGSIEVSPSLAWETDCKPPVPPILSFHRVEGYTQAVNEFNAHVVRVQHYIRCVQSAGKADIDALAEAINRAMREKQNAAIDNTEKLRTELEVNRSLLR